MADTTGQTYTGGSSSLFTGTPLPATSYTQSTSETPKWLQDAIYNQIQRATQIANVGYEPYNLPRTAQLSPLQQQAYQGVVANQGVWQPGMEQAQQGILDLSKQGTAAQLQAAQQPYLRPDLVGKGLEAGQSLFDKASQLDMVGAASPYLKEAASMSAIKAAQPYLTKAAAQDIVGAAQPFLSQAGQTTAQSLSERALTAAAPYLQAAGATSVQNVGQYMSPYQQNVLDVIARQGAKNLQENILPQIGEAFIKSGQFGSSRMGDITSRAIRDTQKSILDAQAAAAQQGYQQALGASQADLARQAALAGTVGQISGADLARILSGGSQYGALAQTAGGLTAQQAQNLANIGQQFGGLTAQQAANLLNVGQTTGQLTSQQMQNLTNIGQTFGSLTGQQMQNLGALGQMQTQAGQAQQQFGLGAAQAAQGASSQDLARQQSALSQFANLQQMQQGMRTADIAALESAGQQQQAQQQREFDAAYQQSQEPLAYAKSQMDWLNAQIRGMAPSVPTIGTSKETSVGQQYAPSALATVASVLSAAKGLNP